MLLALVAVHTVPHAPQSVMVVLRSVSQPFLPMPSQLPNPVEHDGTQLLAMQELPPLTA